MDVSGSQGLQIIKLDEYKTHAFDNGDDGFWFQYMVVIRLGMLVEVVWDLCADNCSFPVYENGDLSGFGDEATGTQIHNMENVESSSHCWVAGKGNFSVGGKDIN